MHIFSQIDLEYTKLKEKKAEIFSPEVRTIINFIGGKNIRFKLIYTPVEIRNVPNQ